MTVNFSDELGQRVLERIQSERVIWLTTVSPTGVPQPRPVWFVYENGDFIIYSTRNAKKLSHIAQNANVSLHFNTDKDGYDIQVLLGTAKIDKTLPPSSQNQAYSQKYGGEILTLDMDEEKYAQLFCVGVRITPKRLRGLDPIPEA
jgi:PPOX class probable F420-dependent enzyme